MAIREVRMCDRKDSAYNDQPCPSTSVCTGIVCQRDVCVQHKNKDALLVRVEAGSVVFGYADLGEICRMCGVKRGTTETQNSLTELLAPLRDQIVEILRAQQTAEALK